MEPGVRKVQGKKPDARINLLFWKKTKGSVGLIFPTDVQIVINSTYAFTSYALWRNLAFNPGKFGTETNYCMAYGTQSFNAAFTRTIQ